MKRILTTLAFASGLCWGATALAQTETPPPAPDCAAKATDKKLAGAALNSFMKKCERDTAAANCNAAATEKKLSGAARNSFTKKCLKDAIQPPAAQ